MDPSLKILVDDSQFPAEYGTDVKFTCPQNTGTLLLDRNVKAVCADYGKIMFFPEDTSPCDEISKSVSKLHTQKAINC